MTGISSNDDDDIKHDVLFYIYKNDICNENKTIRRLCITYLGYHETGTAFGNIVHSSVEISLLVFRSGSCVCNSNRYMEGEKELGREEEKDTVGRNEERNIER